MKSFEIEEITGERLELCTMNYKLEKFWNIYLFLFEFALVLWTINLKSFEIIDNRIKKTPPILMNYKLEKFWNSGLLDSV